MMDPPPRPDRPFDSSKPFEGLVLCCTSIEADLRTEIAQRTADLGGIHKYDLTPDVTHLIVGDYDTAKYRHVARERPDIKPMAAGWVDAVRELWMEDKELDLAALEDAWRLKTFETGGGIPKSPVEEQRERTRLTCCLTGFEDNEMRVMIEGKVRANGGDYVGDLSRRVTHLIVCKPEGKKYIAARKWGIRTVSIEWLHDSVERGMILNEECYDPTLPAEERGKGAWIRRELKRGASLGKRPRDGMVPPLVDDGRRKLRKTASMKFTSKKDNLWGDILVKQSSVDLSKSMSAAANERSTSVPPILTTLDSITPTTEVPQLTQPNGHIQQVEAGVFSSCRFYVHGFPRNKREIVHHHISSHDGRISQSIEDAASLSHGEPLENRYLVVPQTSQPDTHPQLPEGMHIVTEFYIERCVHNRFLFKPQQHVLGQPFPRFPIDGFHELMICTSGFRNEQLNQVEKSITQLGAKYSERLNTQCSLLICPSLDGVRKQKLDFAMSSKIPVVDADWLWQCITTGCLIPWDAFLFRGLPQKHGTNYKQPQNMEKDKTTRSESEAKPRKECDSDYSTSGMKYGIDMTAFNNDTPIPQEATVRENETTESNYETAPTHQEGNADIDAIVVSAPLTETTSNLLNKSPSLQKVTVAPRKLKRFPTGGEVGDSESGEESDTLPNPREKEDDGTAKDDEEERKRQAERTKAAERKEMSKRLDSLMARDEVAQEADNTKPQPAPQQQRRRRAILGRAASNVSATSSASAESLTHVSGSKSNPKRTASSVSRPDSVQTAAGSFGLLDEMIVRRGEDGDWTIEDGDSPPRATQLKYDNSEAQQHRAVVVDRMMADTKLSAPAGSRQRGRGLRPR